MNDIRFLTQLGDNLEEATRRSSMKQPKKNGPRRQLFVAVAVMVTAVTGIAAATQIINKPESLAANSIGCYETSSLSGNVAVLAADGEPPVKVCNRVRAEAGLAPVRLVACARGDLVAVLPRSNCSGADLQPLPIEYEASVKKMERLDQAIKDIEESADCTPPEVLAEKAQGVLDSQGWEGWQVEVKSDGGLPCGRIRGLSGDGTYSLTGMLNPTDRVMSVSDTFPHSLDRELFGENGAMVNLYDASGKRCLTLDELKNLARRGLDTTKYEVMFSEATQPNRTAFTDARQRRYEAGCAVISEAGPSAYEDGKVLLNIKIYQR